ncbi:hypothetical protein JCM6882_005840 [Rhodosporidiobolus microsporus]
MPLCAVCPTETDLTCSGGCGTVFCSEECKQLVWEDAHEFLCASADPEACYLPPLNRRERKAWLDLLEGRMEMFPNARTDEKVVEQIEREREACGGNWENFLALLCLPSTPIAEPSRSFSLSLVRSTLWSERQRWHLALFDRRTEIWSTGACELLGSVTLSIPLHDQHGEYLQQEEGAADPFRTYNALLRHLAHFSALFLSARDVLPPLVAALTPETLDEAFRRAEQALKDAPGSRERRSQTKDALRHEFVRLKGKARAEVAVRREENAQGLLKSKQRVARRAVEEREEVMGPA